MSIRKTGILLLLLLLCLVLTGCRTRTGSGMESVPAEGDAAVSTALPGSRPGGDAEDTGTAEEQAEAGAPGSRTREDPAASRKEYDENAPAEIVPGTQRTIHGEGEGSGAFTPGTEADRAVPKLDSTASETAAQTVPADQAEEMGVSEDAKAADSALQYYTVLLRDRMGGLFECQRLNVYWETAEDHVTIFRTSPEHSLILNAGAYDVSARLLEENLRVDDGWIGRKNPDLVVKVVDRSVLGTGVAATGAAREVYGSLLSREGWSGLSAVRGGRVLLLSEELLEAPHLQVAAMLMIAKTANPEIMADVDPVRALAQLAEEATGAIPAGLYGYGGADGL